MDDRPILVLDTRRLRLRPYRADDLDDMAEMFGDREVTAHTLLGWQDREGTARVLEEYMSFLAANGHGMLAITDRVTGEYLGECGLFVSPMGPLALRYALNRASWGRGYATEASIAVVDDAFDRLGLDKLLAGVVPANLPSMKVMDKLGFAFCGEVSAAGHDFHLFEVTREAWRMRRSG